MTFVFVVTFVCIVCVYCCNDKYETLLARLFFEKKKKYILYFFIRIFIRFNKILISMRLTWLNKGYTFWHEKIKNSMRLSF